MKKLILAITDKDSIAAARLEELVRKQLGEYSDIILRIPTEPQISSDTIINDITFALKGMPANQSVVLYTQKRLSKLSAVLGSEEIINIDSLWEQITGTEGVKKRDTDCKMFSGTILTLLDVIQIQEKENLVATKTTKTGQGIYDN